jgi:predicted nucleic acid-binding protein
MTILVDTNVVLDILEKREPFFQDSFAVFRMKQSIRNGNIRAKN